MRDTGKYHKTNLQKNNSRRNLCRKWKRGSSGKGDNVQKKHDMFKSKRNERMVRCLHFLVLRMVISRKNSHTRPERQGTDSRETQDGS